MVRSRGGASWRCVAAGILVLGACAAALAGEAPPPKAETPPKPTLTPEQQAAQDLLQRYKAETTVKDAEKRFLAAQHVAVGKDMFDMQDFKGALRHFEKAVELDPADQAALEYLKKTRGLLGIKEGNAKDLIGEIVKTSSVAIQVQKAELELLFAEAKSLYAKGQYAEAMEAFTRVSAKAKYLAPRIDAGNVAAEAEVYIRRATSAIEERRQRDAEARTEKARKEAEQLRQERQKAGGQRSQALYHQALTLAEQHRYDEARKLADEILRSDPDNGAAIALRDSAAQAARNAEIDRAIRLRRTETDQQWREVVAGMTPQSDLAYMPPGMLEIVRNRRTPMAFGDDRKPKPEWEARVRDALGKKVSFDFVETPLQDVITFLASLTDTSIILDSEAVKGQAPSVTLRVNEMRLEAALGWICKLVGLAYNLKDEAIFVSTPRGVHQEPFLRMYDVTDLTLEIPNFKGNQRALTTSEGWGAGSQGSDLGANFFPPDNEDEKERNTLTGDALIRFIRRLIAPGTWIEDDEPNGGGADRFSDADSRTKGEELVDVIKLTVGGRTWVAVTGKE